MSGETIDGGAPYADDWRDGGMIDPKEEASLEDYDEIHQEKHVLMETESGFVIESDVEVSKVTPVGVAETPIEDVPMGELKQIRLSRKRTVMKFVEKDDEYAYFSDVNEDTGVHQTAYTMSMYDYEAFGYPEAITVGVVNGDILNG